ncbi:hypothetical protein [Vibrio alfacsensis]|uniref:hypothetical protein n=1 Tax=Vibrio alfacsensis TaxID=1074311 RepID=UPI001C7F59EB|nr:hypothetical protein [Vibrio alfacsensis]
MNKHKFKNDQTYREKVMDRGSLQLLAITVVACILSLLALIKNVINEQSVAVFICAIILIASLLTHLSPFEVVREFTQQLKKGALYLCRIIKRDL